jgi:two-component system cell cycle sensor histidine kinase/response regulator CckA
MLAVIQGYSEIALASLPPEDPLAADLEEIRRAATRSETIVSQLMAFSREQRLNPEVIDVDAAIGEMRRMLASLLGEDIDFELDLGSGVWKTKIDRGRFEQIMANLAINARDAMAGGGRLTIATGTVSLDGGDFVVISVEDTGCGMDEETVSHIFEPFYTTKERGKGTGLGLATVYGFVQQSGGQIEVQSEPGRGTTFTICLPRHTADDPALVEDEGLTSRRGGSGAAGATVLVVEDEKMIREMAARVLGEELKVLTASNGREAIEVFRKHEGRIDLLIADVVMPGMNGPEAAAVMKKSHPELAVLYMSGYSDEDKELGVRMEKGDGLLRKPFSLEELEDAVHRALANQREA